MLCALQALPSASILASINRTLWPSRHSVISHDRMRELLADNSEALVGMKCTPDMVAKYKIYTSLAYSKKLHSTTTGRGQGLAKHHS